MKFLSNASFWLPDFFCETGWEGHIPFAFYLVDSLRPRQIVELGTFSGLSYFSAIVDIRSPGLSALSSPKRPINSTTARSIFYTSTATTSTKALLPTSETTFLSCTPTPPYCFTTLA
jgi:hypothetical protein